MPKDKELDPDMIADVYEHLLEEIGRASCQLVVNYITNKGLLNYEGNPYSRQAVHKVLNGFARGRKLLQQTKLRMNRDT